MITEITEFDAWKREIWIGNARKHFGADSLFKTFRACHFPDSPAFQRTCNRSGNMLPA